MNSPEIPDSCPFCGSVVSVLADGKPCRAADGAWVHFKCLTSMHMGQNPRMCQSRPCEEAERQRLTTEVDMLRTANAGLVKKVQDMEAARTRAAANSLTNMLAYEDATKKIAALIKEGDELAKIVRRDYRGAFCEEWERAKAKA